MNGMTSLRAPCPWHCFGRCAAQMQAKWAFVQHRAERHSRREGSLTLAV